MRQGFVPQYCVATHDYAPHADEVEGRAIAWDDWVDNIHVPASGAVEAERDGEMVLVGSHACIAGIEGQEEMGFVPSEIEGTQAAPNPDDVVGAEGDGEVGVAAFWADGAWGGEEGEMRHGALGVAGTWR